MWKVLIVDDKTSNRNLLLEILKDKAACDIARDGTETLTAYGRSVKEEKPYDIILLDIDMPDINGMEVLKRIRQSETDARIEMGKGIPVIMVTAYQSPFVAAFQTGCDDYILKPIKKETLLAKMEEKLA